MAKLSLTDARKLSEAVSWPISFAISAVAIMDAVPNENSDELAARAPLLSRCLTPCLLKDCVLSKMGSVFARG